MYVCMQVSILKFIYLLYACMYVVGFCSIEAALPGDGNISAAVRRTAHTRQRRNGTAHPRRLRERLGWLTYVGQGQSQGQGQVRLLIVSVDKVRVAFHYSVCKEFLFLGLIHTYCILKHTYIIHTYIHTSYLDNVFVT